MTKIMAILNLTPDSFSDGGKYYNLINAQKLVEEMILHKVDIIDIGAESTRPGAASLSYEEEWERLKEILPLIIPVAHDNNIEISLDSYHHKNIIRAIDLGIDLVNDVSCSLNSYVISAAIENQNLKLVLMHNLCVPANPKITLNVDDPLQVIKKWAKDKIDKLINLGITREQIIFDPGLGFGKNAQDSLKIIKNIDVFNDIGKILVGHSRKSFLSLFTDLKSSERDLETHIISSYLASKKIDYLRVHDFIGTKRAISLGKELW